MLIHVSCKKEEYLRFTEKQSIFVNYEKDQVLKFIDSSLNIQTLEQTKFRRDFHETRTLYGGTGNFYEQYEVSYRPRDNGDLFFNVKVQREFACSLDITFFTFNTRDVCIDSLPAPIPSISINGKTYTDVYLVKMYGGSNFPNSIDTATLYHNKQFGVIQLLFRDGKKIVRTD